MSLNVKLIGSQKIIMSNTDGGHPYFAWPSVARLQNGKLVVGASGYRVEHICPFGKAVIAFSDDEGETYSAPRAIIDTVLDDRDVGLTVFDENGLIVTSFNKTLEFQRENMPQTQECFDYIDSVSEEDEAEALGVTFRISHDCGESFGRIYKSPVSSPHGPIQLRDGRILWVGRVLGEHNRIEAHIIDPGNGNATFLGRINTEGFEHIDFYEPFAIELPDGKIVCHLRAENADDTIFSLYQTVSYDGGKTWSKPVQIIEDNSGAPSHMYLHSSGVLIAAFSRRILPNGIRVILSEDGGETWSEEFSLYDNYYTDDLGYPATVELKDGSLLTVFYARDNEECPAVIRQQKWVIGN